MTLKLAVQVLGVLVVGTVANLRGVFALVKPMDMNSRPSTVAKVDYTGADNEVTLFDFTSRGTDVCSWIESSDVVREPGMSKASLTLQTTQLFQRAVFFALLNPQPNGAGFAGVRHPTNFNLSQFYNITLNLRGQGKFTRFKIVLKHHGELGDSTPSYEQFFPAPRDFQTVALPLEQFKPYWRGKPQPDAAPLDVSNVTSFGIQYFGGVYEQEQQSGPATLEINWIRASV